jgi:hypothetical protein
MKRGKHKVPSGGSLLANMLREGRRKDRGRDGTGPRPVPCVCFADFAKIEGRTMSGDPLNCSRLG